MQIKRLDRSILVYAAWAAALASFGCKDKSGPATGTPAKSTTGSPATAKTATGAGAGSQGSGAPKGNTFKIGVLTDMSGLYADLAGPGSLLAAKMAVEEFGGKVNGVPVEVIGGDHLNKPDVGSNLARQWMDVDGVQAIIDVPSSGVALAINDLVRDKNKVFLASGPATADLTGKACTPNTVHWTYDTWALANGTGKTIVKGGGDTWFFITADYAFGAALERDVSAVVKANGGKIVGIGQASAQRGGLLVLAPSSAVIQGQDRGSRQRGRRYDQHDQAGG